ncbi:helix-turn-helix transcriptional regulator [Myroides marinus]|uniref:Helix-turn-helix transcriptional regulator n=1 Tax=Myroides marinus TaxID=703342 RepID=A0A163VF76_9FLAO|nr:LuxR C-terminal-related transcriptional regulator [Myroides marinus]KZE74801.1 helix-turn-helix transcriptional regulator [Myroides marinus]
MDSKKKQQYLIMGTIPIMIILSYIPIYSFINAISFIKNFSIIHTTTKLCSMTPEIIHSILIGNTTITNILSSQPSLNLSSIPVHHDMSNYIELSFNSFVSGIFYGMSFLGFGASLVVYQIFKEKKWLSYLAIQSLILICFIYSDILNLLHVDLTIVESFFRTTILAGGLIHIGMLVSTYYSFGAKRFMYKNELKIYSLTSIIAIVLYFSSYFYGQGHILFLDLIVLALFISTLAISKVLKRGSKYYLYILLLLCQCVLYGICFTNMETTPTLIEYKQGMNHLKLFIILIIIFSIVNNYILIRKNQKHNVRNRVFMFQYVLMLKNYHKLLVDEKNAQTGKQNEVVSLKDHQGDLSYYLKNNYKLTEREVDVLYQIWDGLTNKEIAHELSITISTTKYHISNIYLKLNVSSRAQVFALKDW